MCLSLCLCNVPPVADKDVHSLKPAHSIAQSNICVSCSPSTTTPLKVLKTGLSKIDGRRSKSIIRMEVSVGFACCCCCCCCCYSYLNGRNEGGKGGAGPPLPNSTLCVSHPIVFIFTFLCGGPQRGQNHRIYSTDPTKRLLFYISQSRVAAYFAHHHHHHRQPPHLPVCAHTR